MNQEVIKYCNTALNIPINAKTYINEVFTFDETIDDLLSLAYYNTGNIDKAVKYATKALEINPDNERIKNNLEIMRSKLQNQKFASFLRQICVKLQFF